MTKTSLPIIIVTEANRMAIQWDHAHSPMVKKKIPEKQTETAARAVAGEAGSLECELEIEAARPPSTRVAPVTNATETPFAWHELDWHETETCYAATPEPEPELEQPRSAATCSSEQF